VWFGIAHVRQFLKIRRFHLPNLSKAYSIYKADSQLKEKTKISRHKKKGTVSALALLEQLYDTAHNKNLNVTVKAE
jgi:hypothetical protein